MPILYNGFVTCDSFQNVLPRRGGFQSYPPSSCLHFLRITVLVGCVLRISLGLPPSSTCALHIEDNDRPETSCRTEGIDSRPVSLQEFLQPARLALSFSATSIRHSHRGTDEQPDQSRLVIDQERFSPPGTRRLRREPRSVQKPYFSAHLRCPGNLRWSGFQRHPAPPGASAGPPLHQRGDPG